MSVRLQVRFFHGLIVLLLGVLVSPVGSAALCAGAFDRAVDRVAAAAHELLDALVTNAPPRDREAEAAKARARAAERFGSAGAG